MNDYKNPKDLNDLELFYQYDRLTRMWHQESAMWASVTLGMQYEETRNELINRLNQRSA